MVKRKGLNIYAICESIAQQTGQPLGAVNKAIVAAGLARLLEKTRLDPGTFTEQNVEQLQHEAASRARLHGLLES